MNTSGYPIPRRFRSNLTALALALVIALGGWHTARAGDALKQAFQSTSGGLDAARPWVYWFWLNGNITREGITADLEAMKRAGIGGVLIMEVDQGAPLGPVGFMSPQWRELFKHVTAEAQRLGLEVNMNNDAGWNGSGGPWIKPEQSMQKVVWTQREVEGPQHMEVTFAQPQATAGFYRDIAVLAFPTPGPYTIDNIKIKAGYQVGSAGFAAPARIPPEMVIARDRIIDLTSLMDQSGRLSWEAPPGKWTVMRFGHTSTGIENAPSPASGRGLECDKLSKEGIEANFAGMMAKLMTDVGPAAGKTLVTTHIDSWENGAQNWTARMREEFQKRRGYDLLPFLPTFSGRVVGSLETSERFLWDLRQTISDLVLENYAGHMRTLAQRHGLKLSIEAYGGPEDDIPYAGRADEPMSEFWIGGGAMQTCKEMASAAHIYGKPILGAESFTAADQERWLEHPGSIKALGDQAFCDGVSRFVFHRYAMQPWLDRVPGMTMGPWGLHYERTNTWWDWSRGWHMYLSRCQYMLRRGLFVADLCYLQPEDAPQSFVGHAQLPYDYDNCSAEVVLTRMTVKDGRLVLPDGMSYRLLILPKVATMTPQLLGKIKQLVEDGATVVGPRPQHRSPSLANYPKCDEEVKALANALWGDVEPDATSAGVAEHAFGKGRVFSRVEKPQPVAQDNRNVLEQSKWIWHKEGNPAAAAPMGTRYFRRSFTLPPDRTIESARLVMTADNAFVTRVNDRLAGTGDDFTRTFVMDVTALLKPGQNDVAVAATNGGDGPNPAGLIGALEVHFRDGGSYLLNTNRKWESVVKLPDKLPSPSVVWAPALELGSLGMAPWDSSGQVVPPSFPDPALISEVLGKLSITPDFEVPHTAALRYIHRRDGDTDIYFVANGGSGWVAANCTFRVSGKVPEIWDPVTGGIKPAMSYHEKDGRTVVPMWLEPSGSSFVVFRETGSSVGGAHIVSVTRDGHGVVPVETADKSPSIELSGDQGVPQRLLAWQSGRYEISTLGGKSTVADIDADLKPHEVTGPWNVQLQPRHGEPETIVFDQLMDWSKHTHDHVKYFSGTATYTKTIAIPADLLAKDRRLYLDLGKVQIMADVTLNGKPLGILWKSPFRVDITDAAKSGDNALEVKIVNLPPNRMIGDERLPEDSKRNANGTLKEWPQWLQEGQPSPTGRDTFTSWRLWKKDSPLLESGLLGPVKLQPAAVVDLKL